MRSIVYCSLKLNTISLYSIEGDQLDRGGCFPRPDELHSVNLYPLQHKRSAPSLNTSLLRLMYTTSIAFRLKGIRDPIWSLGTCFLGDQITV